MKKFSLIFRSILLSSLLSSLIPFSPALALEYKKLEDVDLDNLIQETQVTNSDDKITVIWWIPQEFWAVSLSQETSMSETEKGEFLRALEPYFMLAVVQGEISSFGTANFYDLEEIKNKLTFSFEDSDQQTQIIDPAQTVSPEVELLQKIIRPMLEQMMGNLGQNFHFLTFDDQNIQGTRNISPYENGKITVQFSEELEQEDLNLNIDLPLDSLFISRICPNGKEAHVSWKYCPWDGTKLEE